MPPFAGGRSTAVDAPGPLAVRGTPAELAGARRPDASTRIRRLGKFLEIDLDRDRVVVNPMLTGRFQLAAPRHEATRPRRPSSGRSVPGRRPRPKGFRPAAWTQGRRLVAGR